MKADLGLKTTETTAEAEPLNRLVSDGMVLQAKRFHRNATGTHLQDLLRDHGKTPWMLRATAEGTTAGTAAEARGRR
jgi:DNA-binding ferritin-like protein